MREPEKYCGVIPAFYACYDDAGEVSPERVRALAEHLIRKGVKGVYVGGSSGECIYQSVDDRKRTLEMPWEEIAEEQHATKTKRGRHSTEDDE